MMDRMNAVKMRIIRLFPKEDFNLFGGAQQVTVLWQHIAI
jgi:hypothetical protein